MAKPQARFKVEAFDGDFRFKDRVPSASQGHRLAEERPTKESAFALAREFMLSHPPDGEGAFVAVREYTRRGDIYKLGSWRSDRARGPGQWIEKGW